MNHLREGNDLRTLTFQVKPVTDVLVRLNVGKQVLLGTSRTLSNTSSNKMVYDLQNYFRQFPSTHYDRL